MPDPQPKSAQEPASGHQTSRATTLNTMRQRVSQLGRHPNQGLSRARVRLWSHWRSRAHPPPLTQHAHQEVVSWPLCCLYFYFCTLPLRVVARRWMVSSISILRRLRVRSACASVRFSTYVAHLRLFSHCHRHRGFQRDFKIIVIEIALHPRFSQFSSHHLKICLYGSLASEYKHTIAGGFHSHRYSCLKDDTITILSNCYRSGYIKDNGL